MARDPPLTHGIHPKRVHPRRVELYVPEEKLELVDKVKQQLQLDGSSLSAWVLESIENWWKAHAPGNPQTTLERYDVVAQKRPRYEDVSIGDQWFSPKVGIWFKKLPLDNPPAGWTWSEIR